jgi:hypothetical protein
LVQATVTWRRTLDVPVVQLLENQEQVELVVVIHNVAVLVTSDVVEQEVLEVPFVVSH